MDETPANVVEFISRDDYARQFGPAATELAASPGRLPREMTRKRVVTAFLDAFELLGGTDKLVAFASESGENYAVFLRLYGKLAPPIAPNELEPTHKAIIHALPRTALDE